jgi:hypothetical protein
VVNKGMALAKIRDSHSEGSVFNPWSDLHSFFCSPSSMILSCVVVRVSDYRYRGPGFDSWRCQIFRVAVGLERGPLSLVRTIDELLGRSSGSGLENQKLQPWGFAVLTTWHPLSAKVGTNFVEKWRFLDG